MTQELVLVLFAVGVLTAMVITLAAIIAAGLGYAVWRHLESVRSDAFDALKRREASLDRERESLWNRTYGPSETVQAPSNEGAEQAVHLPPPIVMDDMYDGLPSIRGRNGFHSLADLVRSTDAAEGR